MAVLWTSADAEAATGGRATKRFAVTGISIDTRSISAGPIPTAWAAGTALRPLP